MKLIDLLVQHLGGNGGWPIGAAVCAQDNDGEVCFYENSFIRRGGNNLVWSIPEPSENRVVKRRIFMSQAEDVRESIINREQYETALAASQHPEWSGEGLPPVGAKIEVQSPRNSWTEAVVVAVTNAWLIARYDDGVEFAGCYRSLRDDGVWEDRKSLFRPIRTEAERKREEYIAAIIANLDVVISTKDDAVYIYEAIASGKIPGIRLE